MNAYKSGVWIAMAAILVQAPRLVLAVLAADHQAIGAAWERGLLVVAGIGTATVLTGGNLYLAHAIGSARRRRRWLVGVWLLVLASAGGLVVPLIAAGLGGRTLPQLLGGAALTWTWSGLAALAHEVTAAGCVLAAAALGGDAAAERQELQHAQQQEQVVAKSAELAAQRDAARAELAALRQRHGERLPGSAERLQAEQPSGERQPSLQQLEEQAQRQQSWEQQRWLRQSERQQGQPALPRPRSRRAPAAAAGRAAGPAGELVACREGCGREFGSALAAIGHLRHCPVRLARQVGRPA
jgi:hypothetical protein